METVIVKNLNKENSRKGRKIWSTSARAYHLHDMLWKTCTRYVCKRCVIGVTYLRMVNIDGRKLQLKVWMLEICIIYLWKWHGYTYIHSFYWYNVLYLKRRKLKFTSVYFWQNDKRSEENKCIDFLSATNIW